MKYPKSEYVSSVTLMFLGDDLIPTDVTNLLALRPNQSWKRDDVKSFGSSSHKYKWGGWKKYLPKSLHEKTLDVQVAYWARTLASKKTPIRKISKSSALCALDCFITTSATASIIIPVELQKSIAALGLELQVSFWASTSDT